ncbi:EDD domain protein, partial [Candidatus Epulonipiscium fishelsonii]
YFKELFEISIDEFYTKLRSEKIFPKTSLPSINDYYTKFEPNIKNGDSIICVCLSSHFSGSYSAAKNARELILETYPDAQIEIIDSLNATGGQGLLVTEIGRMIKAGLEFKKIIKIAYKIRPTARIFFYVDTLDYLENGGRIGKAAALLGTMLNVKPIIYLENGLLFPISKTRGTKKAVAKVISVLQDFTKDDPQSYAYVIGDAHNREASIQMAQAYNEVMPVPFNKHFFTIGVTIGVNTGPDTCGVAVIKKYENFIRNDN